MHPEPPTLAEEAASYGNLSKQHGTHYITYHADALHLMRHILDRHPQGRFDMIFVDPPYYLSNDGITCHNGQAVSVNKGE